MADRHLHGNFDRCPACELRQEVHRDRYGESAAIGDIPCQVCDGSGHVALSQMDIVQRTVDEARRIYWPAVEARWKAPGPDPGGGAMTISALKGSNA